MVWITNIRGSLTSLWRIRESLSPWGKVTHYSCSWSQIAIGKSRDFDPAPLVLSRVPSSGLMPRLRRGYARASARWHYRRRCQGFRRMSLYRDLLGYLRICYKATSAKWQRWILDSWSSAARHHLLLFAYSHKGTMWRQNVIFLFILTISVWCHLLAIGFPWR